MHVSAHICRFQPHNLGTADAELKVPPLKSRVDRDMATYASPAASNFLLVLISTIPVNSHFVFPNPLPRF